MINPPKATTTPNIATLTIDNWNRGRVSILDENRGDLKGLDESINVQIKQNGTVSPRPSLNLYGEQPTGLVTGWTEAVKVGENGLPINYLITAQRPLKENSVDEYEDFCKMYYAKDGGSWTEITGMTYNSINNHYFAQIDQKVLVTNGVDKTNYIDLETMKINKFDKLAEPTGLKVEKVGLQGGNVVLRYAVTAQSQGETKPVYFEVQNVDRERQAWERDEQSIKLTWNKVTDADRYLIYVGNEIGKEQFLTSVNSTGGNTVSYVDTGVNYPNPKVVVPDTDTTEGVVALRATNVNGQIFLTGDKENPYRIHFGGTSKKTFLNFSPFGGGWIDINPGSKEFPIAVASFRTGKGDPTPTVLCKGTNGNGSMKHLVVQTQEIAGTPFSFVVAEEANGRDGTDSPDAVIEYQDSLWYPSREGIKTTGTKPQVQNILSTDSVSQTIEPDVRVLNTKAMEKASALAYDGKLLFSLPVAGYENTEVWVMDLNRGGIWLLPWTIPAKFLSQYNDNIGKTHTLALVNNKILSIDEDSVQSIDIDEPFKTKMKTSKIFFSDNEDWARVLTVKLDFIKPHGNIKVRIQGRTEDGVVTVNREKKFLTNFKRTGWGDKFNFSSIIYRLFGKTRPAPRSIGNEVKSIVFDIDDDYKWLTIEVFTDSLVSYELNKISIRHVLIGYNDDDEDD